MSNKSTDTSALIAAALIMFFVFLGGYFLPPLMKEVAEYNEWVAYSLGFAFVIGFVMIFWFRSLYQRKQHKDEE